MNITVYCGASKGKGSYFEKIANELGNWIAKNEYTLVYGGGKAGLMGTVADAVLKANGSVIGVLPIFLQERELAHPGVKQLEIVSSMSERKNRMSELGDVCIALPGGPGTVEELTEMISWARIGQNRSPCILFDTAHFYDPLEAMYDRMVAQEFLTKEDRQKILFTDSFAEMEAFITNYESPKVRTYK